MKQIAFLTAIFFLIITVFLPAEEFMPSASYDPISEIDASIKDDKLFITFNYGAAVSWLTRIIEQTERSNFVFKDFLLGLYFSTELQNIPFITPSVRVAAYYPLTSAFNDVPQLPNVPLHFGVDFFTGIRFELNWRFLSFSAGPGFHMFFLNSERWNYLNLGAAAVICAELAISSRWSLLIDFYASIDNGNLGANSKVEPFDIVYQYQTDIGVRYSKKKQNDTALFYKKNNPL